MDGVPVKISEKYKPPKIISLPGSVLNKINVLKEVKVQEYDFSFEKAVLEKVGKINSFKKSVQEKKKKVAEEQVKQTEEATEQLTVVSSEDSSPSPPSAVTEAENVHYQMPSIINTNINMLAPLPVSNTAVCKEKCKVDNALLSEFESDTSSPFDNMELKSINDMQELADVLGTTNKTSVTKDNKVKPINGVTQQWKSSDQQNYGYPCQYYPSGAYTGQVVPSVYSYPPQMINTDRSYQRNYISDYTIPSTVSVPTSSYQPHSPNLSPSYLSTVPPPLPPKPPSLSSNPTSSYSAYNSPAHSYKYSNPSPAIPPKTYQQQQQDNLAYCQPSPSRKSEPEYQPPPSRQDPAEVSLWNDLQFTLQNRRTTNQMQEQKQPSFTPIINSHRPSHDIPKTNDVISSLPNPLSKLSQEGQNLARRMSEMGFPLSRSARAVQLFNSDEAKVIEFLLQVQNFEDRQFSGDLVENALIVNNFNEESALSYLENVKKLIDFGFSEKQVVEALEKTNNDTDRALDLLIT